jgi:hypothetical protein
MKSAIAFLIALIGFFASVAWAADAPPAAPVTLQRQVAEPAPAAARATPRPPAAATPGSKGTSRATKLPGTPRRAVICACAPLDDHA